MIPSSSSRNFSRPFSSPFASPLSTSALDKFDAVYRERQVLAELPHSASQLNMPYRPSPRPSPASKLTYRFVDTSRGDSPTKNGGCTYSPSSSPLRRHGRKNSKTSITSTVNSSLLDTDCGLGTPGRPIVHFRATLWRHLEKDRTALNLDLFWPVCETEHISDDDPTDEDAAEPSFPYESLRPLKTFRNLHYLQLNGMMRSYQPLIWQTCWLNPELTEVHLEMALEPVLNDDIDLDHHKFRSIDKKWHYEPVFSSQLDFSYLGAHAQGTLHEEFGDGEYLDKQAMTMAQIAVASELPYCNIRYLPITKLTLRAFVVDAGPFYRWFDPKRLQEVNFMEDCIDAGFALPDDMYATVKYIGADAHTEIHPDNASIMKQGELTILKPDDVVEVKAGDVRMVSLKKKSPNVAVGNGLKNKLSQIMPRLGKRTRDAS